MTAGAHWSPVGYGPTMRAARTDRTPAVPTAAPLFAPAALLLLGTPCFAADREPLVAPRPGDVPTSVQAVKPAGSATRLAAALGDPRWLVREAASRQIVRRGAGAVPALGAAARGDDAEAAERAVAALGELFVRAAAAGDDPAGEAVLAALDGLAADGSPRMRAAAAGTIDSSRRAASRFSLRAVRRLGGVLKFSRGALGPGFTVHVTLDDRWAGGDAGLHHLRRIDGLTNVYLTDRVPLSDGARADLQAGRYGPVQIELRGRAWLGVTFSSLGTGCEIGGVEPGGPAAKAGLHRGDLIVGFDGRAIRSSSDLTEAIRTGVEVGEPVDVVVRRGLGTATLPVRLERWRSDPAP